MEHTGSNEPTAAEGAAPSTGSSSNGDTSISVTPADSGASTGESCPACRTTSAINNLLATKSNYVYVIGRIEPRFPSLSVEKELAQVTGRAETTGLTDRQALQSVLSNRDNRYLVRQLCWVM